jgi:hypothetical protein
MPDRTAIFELRRTGALYFEMVFGSQPQTFCFTSPVHQDELLAVCQAKDFSAQLAQFWGSYRDAYSHAASPST